MKNKVNSMSCPYCELSDFEIIKSEESEFDYWEGYEILKVECKCGKYYYIENYFEVAHRESRKSKYE